MSRGCGVYGCPNPPVVRVMIADDEGTFTIDLCNMDRNVMDDAEVIGEHEL